MEFGAATALLAKVKRERILDFMTRDELLAWAGQLRAERERFHPHEPIKALLRREA
jgi:hypothetical protein